jgi:hypothetical protein
MDSKQELKMVYTVVERAGKSYWVKIGIGSINKDGSMNLKLDAVPVNGTMQVRDYEPRDDRKPGEFDAPRAAPRSQGALA